MLNPDNFRALIEAWVRDRGFAAVSVDWTLESDDDSNDYLIVAECDFDPGPGRAPVWLRLEYEGYVGIGIEWRRSLIAECGYKSRSPMYAAGIELASFASEELIAILDDVALGRLDFLVRPRPWHSAVRVERRETGKPYAWDHASEPRFPDWGWRSVPRAPWR